MDEKRVEEHAWAARCSACPERRAGGTPTGAGPEGPGRTGPGTGVCAVIAAGSSWPTSAQGGTGAGQPRPPRTGAVTHGPRRYGAPAGLPGRAPPDVPSGRQGRDRTLPQIQRPRPRRRRSHGHAGPAPGMAASAWSWSSSPPATGVLLAGWSGGGDARRGRGALSASGAATAGRSAGPRAVHATGGRARGVRAAAAAGRPGRLPPSHPGALGGGRRAGRLKRRPGDRLLQLRVGQGTVPRSPVALPAPTVDPATGLRRAPSSWWRPPRPPNQPMVVTVAGAEDHVVGAKGTPGGSVACSSPSYRACTARGGRWQSAARARTAGSAPVAAALPGRRGADGGTPRAWTPSHGRGSAPSGGGGGPSGGVGPAAGRQGHAHPGLSCW